MGLSCLFLHIAVRTAQLYSTPTAKPYLEDSDKVSSVPHSLCSVHALVDLRSSMTWRQSGIQQFYVEHLSCLVQKTLHVYASNRSTLKAYKPSSGGFVQPTSVPLSHLVTRSHNAQLGLMKCELLNASNHLEECSSLEVDRVSKHPVDCQQFRKARPHGSTTGY